MQNIHLVSNFLKKKNPIQFKADHTPYFLSITFESVPSAYEKCLSNIYMDMITRRNCPGYFFASWNKKISKILLRPLVISKDYLLSIAGVFCSNIS